MKMKFYIPLCLSILLMLFTIDINSNADSKNIKYTNIPTELHGKWYQYLGNNKWETLKIDNHIISQHNEKYKEYNILQPYEKWRVTNVYKDVSFHNPLSSKEFGNPDVSYDIKDTFNPKKTNSKSVPPFYYELGYLSFAKTHYKGHKILINFSDLHGSSGSPWTDYKVKKSPSNVLHHLK